MIEICLLHYMIRRGTRAIQVSQFSLNLVGSLSFLMTRLNLKLGLKYQRFQRLYLSRTHSHLTLELSKISSQDYHTKWYVFWQEAFPQLLPHFQYYGT